MPRLLLGITGGIAAYKAAELARLLIKAHIEVRVVMTSAAQQFIAPLTLQALTHYPVATDLLNSAAEQAMPHIELARWPDLILIAPASAQTIAKLSHGFADDLLSTLCLASHAPVVLAPAMNQAMWSHAAMQANLVQLRERGVDIIAPATGEQACGEYGAGRLAELNDILALCFTKLKLSSRVSIDSPVLTNNVPLNSETQLPAKWVITAGPTREAIDGVRYLSNYSSGKMGYALATAAAQTGADVVLISGPTQLPCPSGVKRINVVSAAQMLQISLQEAGDCQIFIGAAAVADYTIANAPAHKIKKNAAPLQLTLTPTEDILQQMRQHNSQVFLVGFAAETQDLIDNARSKLIGKQLDLIIANDVSRQDSGFDQDNNQVILIDHNQTIAWPLMSKTQLAELLVKQISDLFCIKTIGTPLSSGQ